MRSDYFAPHHTDICWFCMSFYQPFCFGTVHICNAFTNIESCILLVSHPFNLNKGSIGLLVPQASSVTKDNTSCIQAKNKFSTHKPIKIWPNKFASSLEWSSINYSYMSLLSKETVVLGHWGSV